MISSIRHNGDRSEAMGRTTRIFGARILRSGRRVWTGPALETIPEGKANYNVRDMARGGSTAAKPAKEENNDYKHGKAHGRGGWRNENDNREMEIEMTMDIDEKRDLDQKERKEVEPVRTQIETVEKKEVVVGEGRDRMFGLVYSRKRKRETGRRDIVDANISSNDCKNTVLCGNESSVVDVDRKFGKQFARRKKMRETPGDEDFVPESGGVPPVLESQGCGSSHRALAIVVQGCFSRDYSYGIDRYWIFSCLLISVLRYMRRVELGLQQLGAFLCSEPIVRFYSANGILFYQDLSSVGNAGVCIISGARISIPVFSVDFSALPFCFMYMHSSFFLQSAGLLFFPVMNSRSVYEEENELTAIEEFPSTIPSEIRQAGCEVVVSRKNNTGRKVASRLISGVRRPAGRNACTTNGHNIQKRRSSFRKRGRPPSIFRLRKANGALASDLFRSRHDGFQFSLASNHQLRRPTQRSSPRNFEESKSSLVDLTQDIGAASCFANILVIELDKCFRVEGAIITLEQSESKRWSLTVRKNGMKQCSIAAQKVMRPCSNNRFTHDIIWVKDNGCKLEFANREDWLIFKELYKECFERNLQTPVLSFIPVPRVREVEDYGNSTSLRFVQPNSYITVKDDEWTRSVAKRTANYDMDSDDEEWLLKFNNDDFNDESELHEHLSAESFELMIDALEKAIHSNPDDFSNEEAAFGLFPDLERRVIEGVYGYWIRKREQKGAALIRIFQCYQPRKTQLFPKSVFRKKRSFKTKTNQSGRFKQRTFLRAIAPERDAVEEQNSILKVQEATAAANRSESLAIIKRERAQQLMKNADLAAYKAAMALRIAEAAQIAESIDAAASFYLGQLLG